jgi:hypothetical protein
MRGLLSDIYLPPSSPPPIQCGSCYSKYLMLFSVSPRSLSVTCGRLMVFPGYSGFIHQYSWNIIESGVKHHNPNPVTCEGSLWTLSYGSRIYNYLCNQCVSPLRLWVRTPIVARCTWLQHYVIKFVSDLRQVGVFDWIMSFKTWNIKSTSWVCLWLALGVLLYLVINFNKTRLNFTCSWWFEYTKC